MKKNSGYRISTVSKLTGISSETLRIWEHRYGIIKPERSSSGVRLYKDKDIQHLSLLKQLITHGDSIGNLADLPFSELEKRLKNFTNIEKRKLPADEDNNISKVCVLGPTLPLVLNKYDNQGGPITFTGLYIDNSEFESKVQDESPDLLILEYATILDDDVSQIKQYYRYSNANRLLVVYGFSNSATLKKLDHEDIILVQGPIDYYQILNICNISISTDNGSVNKKSRFLKPRKFTDQQLSELSMMETSVKCECPQHLAKILSRLNAFESYSRDCEDSNEEDAALHQTLYEITASARTTFESALDKILELENIDISNMK